MPKADSGPNLYHCSISMFGYGEKRLPRGKADRPPVDQQKRKARADKLFSLFAPKVKNVANPFTRFL
jgi:hypothetical protein